MDEVTPNLFCNACQGFYALPHTCGKDKPLDLDKPAKDPNGRPSPKKNLEEMTEQDIEELRSTIAAYDARNADKRLVNEIIGRMLATSAGNELVKLVKDRVGSTEAVGIFHLLLLEKTLP